jgi:putative endonuclease
MNNRELGRLGERLAQEYLAGRGYKILAANYRVGRLGEIDLIASAGDKIYFVEVKSRTSNRYGTAAEAVSYKKQKTIRQVAACFLKAHGAVDCQVQFDIIEVMMTRKGDLIHIRHLEKVF